MLEITSLNGKGVGIDFGTQYRLMYNNSNIQSDKQYDFLDSDLILM